MGARAVLSSKELVVLFDSTCLLCNKSVLLLLKIDRKRRFKIASISSDLGVFVSQKHEISADSIVLLYQNNVYIKSQAILKISALLVFPYFLFSFFYIVPRFIRDWLYDIIAANRTKWFGKLNHCIINEEKYVGRIIG